MRNLLLTGLLLFGIVLISGCDSCKKFERQECIKNLRCVYGVAGCVSDPCTELDETSCKEDRYCVWINEKNLYGCHVPKKFGFAGFECSEAEHLEDHPDKARSAQKMKSQGEDWKGEACSEGETLHFGYDLEDNIMKCTARCYSDSS